ncbi:UNVERIFIED_CONTAM: hypothetical protein GTU68_029121 [Idotea baltica]|nr:hypothetical protein [Idotea baltica]
MDHLDHLKQTDPSAVKNHEKYQRQVAEWVRLNGNQQNSRALITIPTVVHVVYRNASQNLSDAEIFSQIDALNEDFRKLNADTSNIPGVWTNTMADTEIEFCLAKRDPQGNPSTGIVRVATSNNNFGLNDEVKFTAQGGSDAWPRDEYLNIWVCDLGGGLLGYAQFPGQAANTDGVVGNYQYFGTLGSQAPFDKGRTVTHEVGHWLGLFHIWGDDGGACSGSDNVADTPNQAGASGGCPTFPQTDNCSSTSPGYMFMNYMDYTNDACMNSFTQGQATVMQATLNGFRAPLQNSNGCTPVNLLANDAEMIQIIHPSGTSCASSITPLFTLYNRGSNPITSFQANWQVDGGTISNLPWTGNLPSLGSANFSIPSIPLAPGNHSITIFTSLPNGVMDDDVTNDTLTQAFVTQSAPTGQPTPFSESFESGSFPPAGWSINNPDNDLTWELFANAGSQNGSRSARMNYYDYQSSGERDELILPTLDLTNAPSGNMTFDVSYKLYSQSGFSDSLFVQVSSDCGNTWTTVYVNGGQSLTTASPYYTTSSWVPTGNDNWRTETFDLSNFVGMAGIDIKFVGVSDYENNLYIDNINILPVVNLDAALQGAAVTLSPNPGHDQFRLDLDLPSLTNLEVDVLNALGQVVWHTERKSFRTGSLEFNLDGQAKGIYFVRVATPEGMTTRKLIRQ